MWYDSGESSRIGEISRSETSKIGGILCSGTAGILKLNSGARSGIDVISSPGPGVKSGAGGFFLGPFHLTVPLCSIQYF